MEVWNTLSSNHEALRSIALAGAAFVGLPFLIWRTIIANQQTKASLKQASAALKQAQTSEANHVSDMFTKAIEQLGTTTNEGKPNIELRLGGLYALEKIAQNNQEYHPPIMEVLTSYLRLHSPRTIEINDEGDELKEIIHSSENSTRTDIQVAIKIIGRRRVDFDSDQGIDLSNLTLDGIDLTKANLSHARITGSSFNHSDLTGVRLRHSIIKDSDFSRCTLGYADFTGSDMSKVSFSHARLQNASFRKAKISGANFDRSLLHDADYCGSSLFNATFHHSYNGRVEFSCAKAGNIEPPKMQKKINSSILKN